MRSEQEMFDLILSTARQDPLIRAVVLNGSRANPAAPRDFFQDFDIVYLVTDPAPFTRNLEWIRRFGEMMILQLPDDMGDPPPADRPARPRPTSPTHQPSQALATAPRCPQG